MALGLSKWFAICIRAGILSSVGALRRNWKIVSTLSGNGKSDLCFLTWSVADNNICVLVRARETNPPEKVVKSTALLAPPISSARNFPFCIWNCSECKIRDNKHFKLAKHKLGLSEMECTRVSTSKGAQMVVEGIAVVSIMIVTIIVLV